MASISRIVKSIVFSSRDQHDISSASLERTPWCARCLMDLKNWKFQIGTLCNNVPSENSLPFNVFDCGGLDELRDSNRSVDRHNITLRDPWAINGCY